MFLKERDFGMAIGFNLSIFLSCTMYATVVVAVLKWGMAVTRIVLVKLMLLILR